MASGDEKEDHKVDLSITEKKTKAKNEEALIKAARSGDYRKVDKLLQLGVSIEVENIKEQLRFKVTPLQIAVVKGHVKCVQMLIDYGAKLDAEDKFGHTAVHLAAKDGSNQCLKMLLEAGADPYVPVGKLLHKKTEAGFGKSALHLAVIYNNAKCLEELMKFCADSSTVDKNYHSCLFFAAVHGFSDCLLILLRTVHDVASVPTFEASNTLLHYTIENRMEECIKELVCLGADVNHLNDEGLSPLHLVFLTCTEKIHLDMEILKHLVLGNSNVDINKTTLNGETALDFAVFVQYDQEIITFLITYGADINKKLTPVKSTRFLSERIHNFANYESWKLHSLLEYELMTPSGLDVVQCLVKCMPQVPHLKSLNICSASDRLHDLNACFEYPFEEEFRLVLRESSIYVKIVEHEVDEEQGRPSWYIVNGHASKYTKYPLEQPHLSQIYETVIQKLKHMTDNAKNVSFYYRSQTELYKKYLLMLKKQLWYEQLAFHPPALQHVCRLSIRECMSPPKLKHIRKLPLPEKLMSYLAFELDE